jgi:hypothetical protein
VPALVDHTHDKKQRTRAQAMVDHLQDGAFNPLGVQGEQTQHDETQVAHRGVRHQLLDIML